MFSKSNHVPDKVYVIALRSRSLYAGRKCRIVSKISDIYKTVRVSILTDNETGMNTFTKVSYNSLIADHASTLAEKEKTKRVHENPNINSRFKKARFKLKNMPVNGAKLCTIVGDVGSNLVRVAHIEDSDGDSIKCYTNEDVSNLIPVEVGHDKHGKPMPLDSNYNPVHYYMHPTQARTLRVEGDTFPWYILRMCRMVDVDTGESFAYETEKMLQSYQIMPDGMPTALESVSNKPNINKQFKKARFKLKDERGSYLSKCTIVGDVGGKIVRVAFIDEKDNDTILNYSDENIDNLIPLEVGHDRNGVPMPLDEDGKPLFYYRHHYNNDRLILKDSLYPWYTSLLCNLVNEKGATVTHIIEELIQSDPIVPIDPPKPAEKLDEELEVSSNDLHKVMISAFGDLPVWAVYSTRNMCILSDFGNHKSIMIEAEKEMLSRPDMGIVVILKTCEFKINVETQLTGENNG